MFKTEPICVDILRDHRARTQSWAEKQSAFSFRSPHSLPHSCLRSPPSFPSPARHAAAGGAPVNDRFHEQFWRSHPRNPEHALCPSPIPPPRTRSSIASVRLERAPGPAAASRLATQSEQPGAARGGRQGLRGGRGHEHRGEHFSLFFTRFSISFLLRPLMFSTLTHLLPGTNPDV